MQKYGYREYNSIMRLILKYDLSFKSCKDYEDFVREITEILKI
jgi:hypothetical protein